MILQHHPSTLSGHAGPEKGPAPPVSYHARPGPAIASIPCTPSATRRSVHSSLRPAALLIPCACCAPLASVITAPSRPSPHRTDSQATPDTQDSPHGQPPAPPPCRMRPEKRPHAARHHPLIRQQATGPKACHLPAKLAFQPRRQKQGPLRGGFHWGAPQTPAIMTRPKRPGHPPRPPQPQSRSTLKRPAPPSNSWGQPQTPQKGF